MIIVDSGNLQRSHSLKTSLKKPARMGDFTRTIAISSDQLDRRQNDGRNTHNYASIDTHACNNQT